MSLVCLGLRLAMLDALTQHSGPVWATLAENRFHDSRAGPLDGEMETAQAHVIFSVETVKGESLSELNGGRGLQPVAAIIFQCSLLIRAAWHEDGEAQSGLVIATSDHEAEDILDTLLEQIEYALSGSYWVRQFAPRWLSGFESEPYRDETTGERYASRVMTISAGLAEDGLPLLQRFAARSGLVAALQARAAAAIARAFAGRAVADGPSEPFEAADDRIVVGGRPQDAPPEHKIAFQTLRGPS